MRRVAFALPLLLLMPAGAALAQASGSYQNSCTDISQNGSVLVARCKGPGGMYNTTIDLDRCGRMGVANDRGRLTCGNQRGSARPGRDSGDGDYAQRGYGDGDTVPRRSRRYDDGGGNPRRGYDGYGGRPRYQGGDDGYAPRRRYYDPDAE